MYIYILISNHAAHFAILGLTIISGLNGWINGWWNSLTLFHWLVRVFLLSVYHYMFNVWLKPFKTIILASLIINYIYISIQIMIINMILTDNHWYAIQPPIYIHIYMLLHIAGIFTHIWAMFGTNVAHYSSTPLSISARHVRSLEGNVHWSNPNVIPI